MKYAIYGVNRVAKDFLYIFDDIEVVCFFDDNYKGEFLGFEVYAACEIAKKRADFDILIICDFDNNQKIQKIKNLGLKHGADFLLEEEFFEQLDVTKYNITNKPIAVWGTGRHFSKLMEWCSNLKIEMLFDSFNYGSEINGIDINDPKASDNLKKYFIIVAVAKNDEICRYLENLGLEYGSDYCTDFDWMSKPSELLRMTIFDQKQYNLECKTMLNHAEVGAGGTMVCCCTTFIYHSIGNLLNEPADSIWKSSIHKIMCLSNVNHTYSFCKKNMCPFFIDRKDDAKYDLLKPYESMQPNPTTLLLSYETSCNLKCITCRDDYKKVDENERKNINTIVERVRTQLMPNVEFLISAGDGETLLCKSYRDIIMGVSVKNLKYLRLLTNGMLFTAENFRNIREHTDAKIMMTVSIDAATKESYEKIRRGGNFAVLQKNMEYAAHLRQIGELSYLRFNFVVQKENYKEMPDFVKWGKSLCVDEVFFTKILNWGTYSSEEFREISMMQEDGVTPKPELLDILNNPLMKDKIVDLGTIQYGRDEVIDTDKTNYYRWELDRKVPGIFEI